MQQLEKHVQLVFDGYSSCAGHDGRRLGYLVVNCDPPHGADSLGGGKNTKSTKTQIRMHVIQPNRSSYRL